MGQTVKGDASKPNRRVFSVPYEYRGKSLDPFQQEALIGLMQSMSTLVSAPTGTGKTLIADFLVEKTLEKGKRVIYTGPIKALIAQKYREFASLFGTDRVGIVTGDVTVQPGACVVVMTTEILRNMLLRGNAAFDDVDWVVFDEIHYIGHAERGAVWEQALLLLPQHVRVLGLSATIPNASELAAWLEKARGEPIHLVTSHERAVPLEHYYFNRECKAVSRDAWVAAYLQSYHWEEDEIDPKGGHWEEEDWRQSFRELGGRHRIRDDSSHLDVIEYVAQERLFPCLYFDFSRRGAAAKAEALAKRSRVLPEKERESVRVTLKRTLAEMGVDKEEIPGLDRIERLWYRGIGLHHAGLLPAVRRVTELLLERRTLRVVYATETFAVGVNMPVRSVCFDSMEKFDGRSYRRLTANEYFQMAGRAGRRGLDRRGVVIVLLPFSKPLKEPPPRWEEAGLQKVQSSFSLTYNTVINLIRQFDEDRIRALFSTTFRAHQAEDEETAVARLLDEFFQRRGVLERLGYIQGGVVTEKGRALSELFIHELLFAELLWTADLETWALPELAGLAAAFVDEGDEPLSPALSKAWPAPKWTTEVEMVAERLRRLGAFDDQLDVRPSSWRAAVVARWCSGWGLGELQRELGAEPGDVVTLCRQSIDLLSQMARAAAQKERVSARLREAAATIDRGVVRVQFG